ncbi:MAG: LuxR family transcriptional regulator [Sorangiineae bacterium PRO1]|nr:LuxR family transcriptional regulator [Sorangiineae bacterium PRO1]
MTMETQAGALVLGRGKMVRVPQPGNGPGGGSLGDVALAADRASSDADTEACDKAWRDLVSGRLRIIQRFDKDGRRYVVARRSKGTKLRGVQLTERELSVVERRVRGAPLKDIAAALGVSISTVAKSLKRALGKLGLENQAELIAVLGASRGTMPKK